MIVKIKEAGGDPRAELPRGKDNPTYQLKRRKLADTDFSDQKIVIDLGFDDQMNEKDIRSLVSQLTYLYGRNRVMERPMQIYLTDFGGQTEKGLTAHNGFEHWKGVNSEKRPYIDIFPKDKLVYLSAESETTLETLNEDDIYIIGGLVDHNRLKGVCHKKATDQGIRTARLPIDNFMSLKTRKVLTVNQVYEILAAYATEKDWAKAFDSIIPKRKGGSLIEPGSSTNQTEESNDASQEKPAEEQEEIDEESIKDTAL
jgi:tRNA (guanine9-N1)-methyltransferase